MRSILRKNQNIKPHDHRLLDHISNHSSLLGPLKQLKRRETLDSSVKNPLCYKELRSWNSVLFDTEKIKHGFHLGKQESFLCVRAISSDRELTRNFPVRSRPEENFPKWKPALSK